FYLTNIATGKVLTAGGNGLKLSAWENAPEQIWHTEPSGSWLQLVDRTGRTQEGNWDLFHAPAEVFVAGQTEWLRGAYGIMMHVLPDSVSRGALKNRFDVTALADQLVTAGVDYYVISIGQISGVYNSANARLSDIVTQYKQARDIGRGLMTELYDALSARGIRLGVYIPYCPPFAIASDAVAFGWEDTSRTPGMDTSLLWSSVIREWSERYGDKISLWWIDGGPGNASNNQIFPVLADAARAGNPDAAVAFNTPRPLENVCNYYGSENIWPLGDDPTGANEDEWVLPSHNPVYSDAIPWGMASFVGCGWQNTDMGRPIYEPSVWARYAQKVREEGGFLLLDTPITSRWLIDEAYMDTFTAIRDARAQ
ncbi:MAG: hypothetical protein KIG36_02455, partial [Eubacteriales bacterium]|nr:hypothetical protein [Eubacteriales bacterium]